MFKRIYQHKSVAIPMVAVALLVTTARPSQAGMLEDFLGVTDNLKQFISDIGEDIAGLKKSLEEETAKALGDALETVQGQLGWGDVAQIEDAAIDIANQDADSWDYNADDYSSIMISEAGKAAAEGYVFSDEAQARIAETNKALNLAVQDASEQSDASQAAVTSQDVMKNISQQLQDVSQINGQVSQALLDQKVIDAHTLSELQQSNKFARGQANRESAEAIGAHYSLGGAFAGNSHLFDSY